MDAAQKIRMLFDEASISSLFPKKYQSLFAPLQTHITGQFDFPKIFTELRNSIVHTDLNKRNTLSRYSSMQRFHITQLGVHYLELLIFNVLKYNGFYANRVSENMFTGGNKEKVPWVI